MQEFPTRISKKMHCVLFVNKCPKSFGKWPHRRVTRGSEPSRQQMHCPPHAHHNILAYSHVVSTLPSAGIFPLKSAPSVRRESGPHLLHGSWIYMSQPSNSNSIGSAVFAQLIVCPTHRRTDRQTHHATYDICNNSLHLMYSVQAMRPKRRLLMISI